MTGRNSTINNDLIKVRADSYALKQFISEMICLTIILYPNEIAFYNQIYM